MNDKPIFWYVLLNRSSNTIVVLAMVLLMLFAGLAACAAVFVPIFYPCDRTDLSIYLWKYLWNISSLLFGAVVGLFSGIKVRPVQ